MRYSIDPLRTARGILIGLLLSLPLCGLMGWALASAARHSAHVTLAHQETDLGSSFRIANGGR